MGSGLIRDMGLNCGVHRDKVRIWCFCERGFSKDVGGAFSISANSYATFFIKDQDFSFC